MSRQRLALASEVTRGHVRQSIDFQFPLRPRRSAHVHCVVSSQIQSSASAEVGVVYPGFFIDYSMQSEYRLMHSLSSDRHRAHVD